MNAQLILPIWFFLTGFYACLCYFFTRFLTDKKVPFVKALPLLIALALSYIYAAEKLREVNILISSMEEQGLISHE